MLAFFLYDFYDMLKAAPFPWKWSFTTEVERSQENICTCHPLLPTSPAVTVPSLPSGVRLLRGVDSQQQTPTLAAPLSSKALPRTPLMTSQIPMHTKPFCFFLL